MPMTAQAIENDKKLGVPLIPIAEIWADEDFNCRAWFSPSTCIPLANDIGGRGLVQPITVRALRPKEDKGLPSEDKLIAKGFKYKLIAGFRRKTAYTILKATHIPALVKDAYISDFECRDINAVENLHRSDLNLWEECRAIRHYWNNGWTNQEIADRVNQSITWVDVRIKLLEMPEEVQEFAAKGYIIQNDIRELYKYRHERDTLLKAAARLRDLRKNGHTRNITHLIKKRDTPNTRKTRKRTEIFELMQIIREVCKEANRNDSILIANIFTENGNSLITRALGWAAGEVSTGELYEAVSELAALIDVHFDANVYMETDTVHS